MWTQFWDMNSGGWQKEDWSQIYIEAPEEEAKVIFYNRFGHNPERITCTCCGEDYSIDEYKTLTEATAYHRGCDSSYFRPDGTECSQDEAWVFGKGTKPGYSWGYVERGDKSGYNKYKTLDEFLKSDDILVIYANDIKDDEREGYVPQQGYVWM